MLTKVIHKTLNRFNFAKAIETIACNFEGNLEGLRFVSQNLKSDNFELTG